MIKSIKIHVNLYGLQFFMKVLNIIHGRKPNNGHRKGENDYRFLTSIPHQQKLSTA